MTDTITVHLIDSAGTSTALTVSVGQSLMEAAVIHGPPGILAECGGSPQCGTCSVFITPEWADALPPPDDVEISVLKFNNKLDAGRRLSCQLIAEPGWDGLCLHLPASQY